jgi:hypothetical protein
MKTCIYCRKEKDSSEFNLEHTIPQFLGGAYAPEKYKIRDACSKCNSNLGLFVDASFEKSWLVSNRLREAAYASFDPNADIGLPLLCLGTSDLTPPGLESTETCEAWLGPLGERIFWIRPKDDRLYWYMGGNPRTTKDSVSRAYYTFSQRSTSDPKLPWRAFRDSFSGRPVKKIMCTAVRGTNPADIGFSAPNDLDKERIKYFLDACEVSNTGNIRLAVNTKFDHRFMAKLAIGIGHSLFGPPAIDSAYGDKLFKTLWQREGDEPSDIQGVTPLTQQGDPQFLQLSGDKNSVTLMIMPSPDGVAINLNIGAALHWTVKCADLSRTTPESLAKIQGGRVITLYRQLQWGTEMALMDYVAHKSRAMVNPQLAEISARLNTSPNYLQGLP